MNEMKKVGILSMQRICNHGSFLQAYGLKKLIEKNGCEVTFVDYKIEPPITATNAQKKKYLKLKVRKKIIDLVYWAKPFWGIYPQSIRHSLQSRKIYESSHRCRICSSKRLPLVSRFGSDYRN